MSPGKYRSSHVWGHVTVLITGTTMNSGLLLGTARGSCLLLSSFKNATHCLRQGLSAYGQNMGGSQCLSTFVEMPHKTVFNLLKCHDATRQQYQDFQYWWMQEVDVYKNICCLVYRGECSQIARRRRENLQLFSRVYKGKSLRNERRRRFFVDLHNSY